MDAGKDADARAELERILRADPRSIDARVQLGFLHGRAKRYDESIAVLREAVNLEPQAGPSSSSTSAPRTSAPRSTTARVETLQEGPRPSTTSTRTSTSSSASSSRSRRKFDDAVRGLPSRHRARSQARRGLQLRRLHVRREAARTSTRRSRSSRKALELEPDNGYFIDSLGWAYYQQGRYPDALRELKRAVEKAKEDPVIFEHLGDAYVKNGLDEDAARRLGEVARSSIPTADGVKKKVEDAKSRLRRVQGERSKASQ